jgi:hypothetical protein
MPAANQIWPSDKTLTAHLKRIVKNSLEVLDQKRWFRSSLRLLPGQDQHFENVMSVLTVDSTLLIVS